ncbi:MAG TPA: pectic acid lyase, partial [Armatimonadetes bacterium]|nr:pectic acid lyase [Armatimonadota bacterium]
GTPSVGRVFLRAYEVTGDKFYLDAALDAARALCWGQLESGGWTYYIDFSPKWSQRWYRRADKGILPLREASGRRNMTTFDDNTTQSALRFLMALVQVIGSRDDERSQSIRDAMEYGLQGLLRAQYPNGAWPQCYDGRHYNPQNHPLKRAWLPKNWLRKPPKHRSYWLYYTFNDNAINDCISTLLEAYRQFGRYEYLEAAKSGGEFIIMAQLPEPQPGWAQQYDFDMKPAWARKFEPPALCSAVTSRNIRTLVDLYLATGDEKYLKPIPAAIAWLERSQIAPNLWARFYELGTNRPLYFNRKYELVYTDDDLPTHYSFKGSYGVRSNIAYYREVISLGRDKYLQRRKEMRSSKALRRRAVSIKERVRRIIASLDEKGRWVDDGWITTSRFISNVRTLCDYIEGMHATH